MRGVLPWYFLDGRCLERGPVPGSQLRELLHTGQLPQGFRVRLPNWDRHFSLEELWPSPEAAFLLPPAWPDVCEGGKPWPIILVPIDAAFIQELHRGTAVAAVPGTASSSSAAAEEPASTGKAKDDINAELSVFLPATPWLRRSDFDPLVLQHLQAFYGLGGMAVVSEALEYIKSATQGRTRESIRSWPAYLVRLLKNHLALAKSAHSALRGSPAVKEELVPLATMWMPKQNSSPSVNEKLVPLETKWMPKTIRTQSEPMLRGVGTSKHI